MSMLSAQCDELQKIALWLDDEFYEVEATKVRDAADTIGQLRDDLQQANAELRKYIEALLGYLDPANRQDTCNRTCPAYDMCKGESRCMFADWAISKAVEFEIEV